MPSQWISPQNTPTSNPSSEPDMHGIFKSPLGLTKEAHLVQSGNDKTLFSLFSQTLVHLLKEWHSKLGFGACWDRIDALNRHYLQYNLHPETGTETRCVTFVPTEDRNNPYGFALEVRTLSGITEARLTFHTTSTLVCTRELFREGRRDGYQRPQTPETHIDGFDIKVIVTVIGLMGLIMKARMLAERKMDLMRRWVSHDASLLPPIAGNKMGGLTVFNGHNQTFSTALGRLGSWAFDYTKRRTGNLNEFCEKFINQSQHHLDPSGFTLTQDEENTLLINDWNLLSLVVRGSQMEYYILSNLRKIVPFDFQCSTQVSIPKDTYYASIDIKADSSTAHLSFGEAKTAGGKNALFVGVTRKDPHFHDTIFLALIFFILSLHVTDGHYSQFEIPTDAVKHLASLTGCDLQFTTQNNAITIFNTQEVEQFCRVAAAVWTNAVDSRT